MLDSANYNNATVTIAKSVTILAIPGAVGSLVAIAGPAVSITATDIKVSFRNIVFTQLTGAGGTDGIQMSVVASLEVENSLFSNLPGNGIYARAATVRLVNSIMRNIAASAVVAFESTNLAVVGTQILQCGVGVEATSGTGHPNVTVSDSAIIGCDKGILARKIATQSGTARVSVTRTSLDDNGTALESFDASGGTAVIRVSGSMITGGTLGWSISGTGASIVSLGNNHFGNAVGSGTLTAGTLQ